MSNALYRTAAKAAAASGVSTSLLSSVARVTPPLQSIISLSSSHHFSSTAAAAPHDDQARIKDYTKYLSPLSQRREPSAIRKLMPLLEQPGMVSLGGGLPNSALFPFTSLKVGISDPHNGDETELHLSTEELGAALQYSPTPGLPRLVSHLRDLQTWEHGVDVGKAPHHHYDVMVSVGSQDALTKTFEMLLDPAQDELFVEAPTYSGALAFLRPFGVKLTPIETDELGLKHEALQEALENSKGENKRRVLYTIPTAQNPSGSTLSNERREAIYDIASEYDMMIVSKNGDQGSRQVYSNFSILFHILFTFCIYMYYLLVAFSLGIGRWKTIHIYTFIQIETVSNPFCRWMKMVESFALILYPSSSALVYGLDSSQARRS